MEKLQFERAATHPAAIQMFIAAAGLGAVFVFYAVMLPIFWMYVMLCLSVINLSLGLFVKFSGPVLVFEKYLFEYKGAPLASSQLISYQSIRSVSQKNSVLIIESDDCDKAIAIPLGLFIADEQPLVAEKLLGFNKEQKLDE